MKDGEEGCPLLTIQSPSLLAKHHALLTDLCERANRASPTAFHVLLASLDGDGRLLRCYTQNIDGLEQRVGLPTGLPQRSAGRGKRKTAKTSSSQASSASETPTPEETPVSGETTPSPPSFPPAPRCIPLHGLLTKLRCSLCSTFVPIDEHLPLPPSTIPCPTCDLSASIRSALSERQRKVGALRADVVLYGEEHPEGELIGSVVGRDLRGTGRKGEREGKVDLLLVAGTTLAIPGVKRIVKEMAKTLEARPDSSVRDGKAPPIRTVFINNEPPAKPGEWDGIFDVWVQGDVQDFAALVEKRDFAPPIPTTPRKSRVAKAHLPTPESITPTKKRKKASVEQTTPTKKQKLFLPLTPDSTPLSRTNDTSEREGSPSPSPRSPTPKPIPLIGF